MLAARQPVDATAGAAPSPGAPPARALGAAPSAAARPLLSPREAQVLQLLADGHTTDGAASVLFLSPATVRSYVENAIAKLEARNRVHAVAAALRLGLIN